MTPGFPFFRGRGLSGLATTCPVSFRANQEALDHGERLLRLYATEVKDERTYGQAKQIVDDLKRRQKNGTFGKTPAEKWPDGFDKWDAKKKTAYLIDALESDERLTRAVHFWRDFARSRTVTSVREAVLTGADGADGGPARPRVRAGFDR
jgi:hypothetical protein